MEFHALIYFASYYLDEGPSFMYINIVIFILYSLYLSIRDFSILYF